MVPKIDWVSFVIGVAFAYFILPMIMGMVRGAGANNA